MKCEISNNIATLDVSELREDNLYCVVVHNDDFTPMRFVIETLERFFYMTSHKAVEITMEAHTKGKAICGVYTREVAETKINEVIEYAQDHEHPLRCSMDAS